MSAIGRALEAIRTAEFSHLGHVYLWPGRFVRLDPPEYLLLMLAGAAGLLAAGALAWRIVRRKKGPDSRRIGIAALAVFALSGAYVTLAYPPTTDEPHYLMISESLVADGDIRLANNYSRNDHLKFYPVREIDPHTVITRDGEMYSQHTAGLPLLIAPAYALGGRWGVAVFLAALAAWLVAELHGLCLASGAGDRAATVAAGALALTAPLRFSSTLVFTETAAALAVAAALRRAGSPGVVAGAAAVLPWLHPRYAVISAGLAAISVMRGARDGTRIRTAGAWTAALAVSGGMFLAVHRGPALLAVLNTLTETYPARLEDLTAANLTASSFANPVVGLLGKLFDRDFGILPYAPWFLLILPALALPALRRKAPAGSFWIAGAPYLLLTLLFRNWGGSAFPGRTLVPLLPFAAPYLALGVEWSLKRQARRAVAASLLAVSIAVSWALTSCPVLRYESGRDWLSEKAGPAARAIPFNWFPSFDAGTLALVTQPAALAAPLLVVFAAVWIRRANGRRRP